MDSRYRFSESRMLLFDALSPAPRTVRMFLLEKGLELAVQPVDVFSGENREAQFLQLNPAGQTPALLLDDGTCLAEAVAIMEYLDERYPSPPLVGTTAEERALTRQWQRRVELNITENIHNAFHFAEGLRRFETRIPVAPEAAPGLKRIAQDRLAWLDGMIGGRAFLAGERFTIADIWLYVWLDFAISVGQPFDRALPALTSWFDRIAARPSAAASLYRDWQRVGVRG